MMTLLNLTIVDALIFFFKQQMNYLKKEGFQTVTHKEIESWLSNADDLDHCIGLPFQWVS